MEFNKINGIADIPAFKQGLYKIVFNENVVYIGRANDIRKRLYAHQGKFKKGEHKNDNFNKAYKQYGLPTYYVFETTNDVNLEKQLIWEENPSVNENIPTKGIMNKKSNFVGCTWNKPNQKWRAKYKNKHIGFFDTEEEAYEAYLKVKGEK